MLIGELPFRAINFASMNFPPEYYGTSCSDQVFQVFARTLFPRQ